MLREAVADTLWERHAEDGYVFPAYGGYSFLNVPGTAADVLGAEAGPTLPDDVLEDVRTDVGTVVIALVDGYGYRCWRRDYEAYPFLRRLTDRGRVTPLTSIYPSETAAAITTVHTARPAASHGLLGWNAYLEETDERIETLPFRRLDGDEPTAGPEALFEGESIYGRLREAGVTPHTVQPDDIVEGAYAGRSVGGTRRHGFRNVADYAYTLRRTLEGVHGNGPTYVYAYLPTIDAISHEVGTEAGAYQAQLGGIADALERELLDRLDAAVAEDTLLLVTADHGHLNTEPGEGIDLREYPDVVTQFRTHRDGEPILPGGTPRNAHLFLEPGTAERVATVLREELDALAFTKRAAIERGLFGPGEPSERFRRRCGDVVVVHRDREVWHGGDPDAFEHAGVHGGLHPDEQLVPFAAARLDTLQGA